jgi:1,4-dihydroxy-6-naphthoate synthase
MDALSFGFSPCPNDTFAFHAVVHELVGPDVRVRPTLRDIEDLNRAARSSELALTKLSVGALAGLDGRYRPLRAGAALGHGVGPLVVAREPATLADATAGRIAVPGLDTTAFLLLRLAAPALGEVVEVRYDQILDAVSTGQVDAGLIIHESRFTYQEHGLVRVADLGEWWEADTGLPVPLAVIGARADLEPDVVAAAETSLRASVEYAFAHPEASREYVRAHSQELSDQVCDSHIALYVNEFSIDLGDEGLRAVHALTSRTGERGS